MSAVILSSRWVARAIVVEQLNAEQWHAVLKGHDVPAGSLEGRAGGVSSFETVVSDALDRAELTGLPVLVEAYHDVPRGLSEVIDLAAWQASRARQRLARQGKEKRLTLNQVLGVGPWLTLGGDAA